MTTNLVISMTEEETGILDDIRNLGFGEIYDLSLDDLHIRNIDKELTPKEYEFINKLRNEKCFDVIAIHDGQPVSAQKLGATKKGRACMKKFRF